MAKFVVLFGAGASIDAGLPSANKLTETVYQSLIDAKSSDVKLFGLMIAKLKVRNVRRGGSPFEAINVEEVYDALKRFINREADLISEFVQSWDQISTNGTSEFDADGFARHLASSFQVRSDRRFDGGPSLSISNRDIVAATEKLQAAFGGEFFRLRGASLDPFINTLSTSLEFEDQKISYMERFLDIVAKPALCLATLNYDRVVERSFENKRYKFDFGLSQWNDKRFVKFHGRSPKLIKLHGSVDWFLKNEDDIQVGERDQLVSMKRAMIFGGQNEKLVPHGPFLHLRHEFQSFLREASALVVVGYSFGDAHLNAIIRSWVATRHKANMLVVDPSGFPADHPVMRYSKKNRNPEASSEGVALEVVQKGFANAIDDIEQFLARA